MQRNETIASATKEVEPTTEIAVEEFLTQAAAAVSALEPNDDKNHGLTDIRRRILQTQTSVLEAFPSIDPTIIESYSQHPAAQELNTAARTTLARLVLHLPRPTTFDSDSTEARQDTIWLEFCGLCQAVVALEGTMEYLLHGNADDKGKFFAPHLPVAKFPFQRMQSLQEHCMAVLGVDPDEGRRQLAVRVGTSETEDDPVRKAFAELSLTVQTILQEASQHVLTSSSDTRVIRVEHSIVGEDDESAAVAAATARSESMVREDYHVPTTNGTAQYPTTSLLEQKLLGELLTMRDEVREERLREASATVDRVLAHAQTLPSMEERVQYLTSLDASTQRSMALKKVWETVVLAASEDGQQPPTMHPSRLSES